MAMIKFLRGIRANMPQTITDGQIYFVTDEAGLYADVGSERIRFGDFRSVANMTALEAIQNPSEKQLFYVEDINVLARWTGSGYVQINLDTGVTSVEVVGEGNVVTESSYDSATRKLTLTKGFTAASKAELDELVEYVGTIPTDEKYANVTDVIGFINAKAEETLAAAQGGSSETAASVKLALDNYKEVTDPRLEALEAVDHDHDNMTVLDGITADKVAEWDAKQVAGDYATKSEAQGYANAKDEAIAAAQAAADKAQEEVDALELAVGTPETGKTIVQMIADAKAAGTGAQGSVDELAGKVGEVAEGKTVVEMIADAKSEATYDDTQIKADIKANADAIEILNGSGEGSVDKKITDAFNDFSTKVSDDSVVNSYKELIDWAAEHGSDAAEMAAAITALQNILDGIGGEGEKATVVAYVTDAISALQTGDLAVVSERLDALEGLVGETAVSAQIKNYVDGLKLAETYASKDTYEAYVASNDVAVAAAHKAGTDAMAEAEKKVNTSDFNTFKDENTQAIADAQAAAEAKAAELDAALKGELQGEINGKVAQGDYDAKIAEIEGNVAKKADDEATTNALNGKVNTSDFDAFKETNTQAIATAKQEAIDEASYDDTALAARVKALEDTDHDFATADAALEKKLVGANTDTSAANTIYGAKAAAADVQTALVEALTWYDFA